LGQGKGKKGTARGYVTGGITSIICQEKTGAPAGLQVQVRYVNDMNGENVGMKTEKSLRCSRGDRRAGPGRTRKDRQVSDDGKDTGGWD